jgi:hypothetical protein
LGREPASVIIRLAAQAQPVAVASAQTLGVTGPAARFSQTQKEDGSMESKVPLPTDNIFKFYALFSLLVFVFSVGAILYSNKTANELAISTLVEIEQLKQDPVPSPSQRMRLVALERQLEVSQANRKFFLWSLSLLVAASIFGNGTRKFSLS